MSDTFAEKLGRFTPDRNGLDRDALLFAAGRASARRSPGLAAFAGLLATTQLLTLFLLWPRPQESPVEQVAQTPPTAGFAVLPPTSDFAESYSASDRLWSATRFELPPTPAADVNMIEAGPPLYAFSATIPEWLR